MDLETSHSVDCMSFDFTFHNILNKETITNPAEVARIVTVLNNLPVANNNVYPSPDTRLKMRMYSRDNTISEICIGKFTILINAGVFLYSDEMLSLLDELYIPKKQRQGQSATQNTVIEFNTVRQYKGFLGAAMGTISFDNGNNFFYDINGSTIKEKMLGTYQMDNDTINCTVRKAYHNLFREGDKLQFMIKADTLFQFNSEKQPDRSRPLTRIR
ncbi:hypothetical protein D0T84_09390 [Dysgonomonas sp. 521]|uniref:hypothetical protein n=1 Tax=Dysgonomonas sp. 521 TaxID=2302932 RepID=UPI0013D01174|nr:hypothetical protein [Dysgonomonas sp. 521]NDV95132.1 hypothetical protein [Dysgonomonas sp. 521]